MFLDNKESKHLRIGFFHHFLFLSTSLLSNLGWKKAVYWYQSLKDKEQKHLRLRLNQYPDIIFLTSNTLIHDVCKKYEETHILEFVEIKVTLLKF